MMQLVNRPATWREALHLMAAGWGAVFFVLLLILLCIFVLNALTCRKK